MALLTPPVMQYTDTAGVPLAFAEAHFYLSGTTTPANVYSDPAYQNSLGPVITADSEGLFPALYLNPGLKALRMKLIVKGGDLAHPLLDIDPISGSTPQAMGVGLFLELPNVVVPIGVDLVYSSGYRISGLGAARYKRLAGASTAVTWRIQDASGVWFELDEPWATPQMFGAYGDGGAHSIGPGDIAAHPEWVGTYADGTRWDTVGFYEAHYYAFAPASLAGVPSWALANNVGNHNIEVPVGQYRINMSVVAAMQGFTVNFASRQNSVLLDEVSDGPCYVCDSAAFGEFNNVSITAITLKDQGQACWSLDGSGSLGGLRTQQVSINRPTINCARLADIGIQLAASGGNAQGDTVSINDGFYSGSIVADIQNGTPTVSSGNSHSISIRGGNSQGSTTFVSNFGGSFFIDGTDTQPQDSYGSGFRFAPVVNQVTTGGAFMKNGPGAGATVRSSAKNIRTEGSVGVISFAGGAECLNVVMANADMPFASTYVSIYLPLGYCLQAGGYAEVMAVVDDGGPMVWYPLTQTGNFSVIGPFTAAWGVGAYAGWICEHRFGGGTVEYIPIVNNTADTLTLAVPIACNTSSMVRIIGHTAAVEPVWSGVAVAKISQPYAAGQGFTAVAGSPILYSGGILGGVANGDYVFIPGGERFGTPGEMQYLTALIAKVIDHSTGGQITVDRDAPMDLDDVQGYLGTGIANGDYMMLRIPFTSQQGTNDDKGTYAPIGFYRLVGSYTNFVGNVDTQFPGAAHSSTFIPGYAPRGSFSPILEGTTTNPSAVTYTLQQGTYEIINGRIFVDCVLAFSAHTGGTGAPCMGGMPAVIPPAPAPRAILTVQQVTIAAGQIEALGQSGADRFVLAKSVSNSPQVNCAFGDLNPAGATTTLELSANWRLP